MFRFKESTDSLVQDDNNNTSDINVFNNGLSLDSPEEKDLRLKQPKNVANMQKQMLDTQVDADNLSPSTDPLLKDINSNSMNPNQFIDQPIESKENSPEGDMRDFNDSLKKESNDDIDMNKDVGNSNQTNINDMKCSSHPMAVGNKIEYN